MRIAVVGEGLGGLPFPALATRNRRITYDNLRLRDSATNCRVECVRCEEVAA